jgi:hypothetical protein
MRMPNARAGPWQIKRTIGQEAVDSFNLISILKFDRERGSQQNWGE